MVSRRDGNCCLKVLYAMNSELMTGMFSLIILLKRSGPYLWMWCLVSGVRCR